MFYDNAEQFKKRTEERTGKTWVERGKDHLTSAGWKDNSSYERYYKKSQEEDENNPTEGRRVIKLPIDAPRDYLVELYGQEDKQAK